MKKKLPQSYYQSEDVESIAKSLIGKLLYSSIDGILTGGIITETEAYKGIEDKASHSYGGKRTNRTEVMYRNGGVTYVYLCYGIHYLLNVVTAGENIPHAVLIRGIYPIAGTKQMMIRTGKAKFDYNLTNGPGKVTKALGINMSHNAISYEGEQIWIEDSGILVTKDEIITGPRIGVDYAEEDALLPYRYRIDYKLVKDKNQKKTP